MKKSVLSGIWIKENILYKICATCVYLIYDRRSDN